MQTATQTKDVKRPGMLFDLELGSGNPEYRDFEAGCNYAGEAYRAVRARLSQDLETQMWTLTVDQENGHYGGFEIVAERTISADQAADLLNTRRRA